MTSLLLLNNFYPCDTDEFKRKRKRRIVVYDSATRYGPPTSCQRKANGQSHNLIIEPINWKIPSLYFEYLARSLAMHVALRAIFALKRIGLSSTREILHLFATWIKQNFSNSTSPTVFLREDPSNSNSTPQWSYLYPGGSRSRSLPVD